MMQDFDAIVIGSGISGGWAAKELCENGLKTLVLERGRMVKHLQDYPTMHLDPWEMKNGGSVSQEDLKKYNKQKGGGLMREIVIFTMMILLMIMMKTKLLIGFVEHRWVVDH